MRGARCSIRVLRFSVLFVVDDVDDAGDDDHVGVEVVITVDEGAPDATSKMATVMVRFGG